MTGPVAAGPNSPVCAAGGVVWRHDPSGAVQVCLVHRPRYDDWSLPKGKLEPGEHPLRAAVREVAEEADVYGQPQVRLPEIRYVTRDGLPKVVHFWSMRAVADGGFQPDTEVDGVRWLGVDEAAGLVSYPHDKMVLAAFAALPEVTNVLVLVRHATAGRRNTWSGPDSARPLDAAGRAQAHELAPLLAVLRPERLLAASARRCVQTLGPLADLLDLPIEVDSGFDEPAPGQDGAEKALAAAARLAELAGAGRTAGICSQGQVIPGALGCLDAGSGHIIPTGSGQDGTAPGAAGSGAAGSGAAGSGAAGSGAAGSDRDWRTPKGGGWLLAFQGDRLVAADRL